MNIRSLSLATFCVAASTVLFGCNGVGAKDSLLARFNDENVYREDMVLLELNSGKTNDAAWNQTVYEKLYSKAAVASYAAKEFPEIEKDWENYLKDIEPRILTTVFQRFFVTECMTYSDSELRRFYDVNRALFPSDSTGDYHKVRSLVAGEYYVSKSAEAFSQYLEENAKNSKDGIDSAAVKQRFIEARRQALQDSISGNILERSHIKVAQLPPVDAREYYEKNKESFKTVPGYVLYHVQASDSATLASMFGDSISLEQFKAVAAKSSKNKLTAKDSGLVGYVKQNFALPGGIGVIQDLAEVLEGKNPGYITPVLRSSGTSVFQRFFLAENVPAQVKPFERAEATIRAELAKGVLAEIDPNFAVILKGGNPLFYESDLMRFNQKYFGNRKLTVNSHERIARMLAETFAYADLAVENKLMNSWEYRALVRSARWDYVFDRYVEKRMGVGSVPEDSLRSLYEKVKRSIRTDLDFDGVRNELEKIAAFPKNLYNHDYLMGYRVIYKNQTFDESMANIYSKSNTLIVQSLGKRFAAEAYTKASTHYYGIEPLKYEPATQLDKMMAHADSLTQAGKVLEAYYAYRDVMYTFPENDSLFQVVAYAMAQVQADDESFLDAEGEYYAFYRMWPENENSEKAMFSRGFILAENLKKDKAALEVFREFLAKYPKSELRESADWMVKNIESEGKLAEDLLQKINTEQ